ncbi:MAG: SMC-Scp complex subunit ScpB [Christensenellaceae bacterium]|jgi:segregation and condensation protein B|nr:SMC-Scp complex subunit ScpB [Christensenellaceae bacterium]
MLINIIEAVLFAAGAPLNVEDLYIGLNGQYTKKEIDSAIEQLYKTYSDEHGIILINVRNRLQFQTNPKYGENIADLLQKTRERELSKTLLQGLSIIAYKQPVTRHELSMVRDTNSDYIVAMLLKLKLIESKGRRDTPGSPREYVTTDEFLRKFGLSDITQLPDYELIMEKVKSNNTTRASEGHSLYHHREIRDDEKEAMIARLVNQANVDLDTSLVGAELPELDDSED